MLAPSRPQALTVPSSASDVSASAALSIPSAQWQQSLSPTGQADVAPFSDWLDASTAEPRAAMSKTGSGSTADDAAQATTRPGTVALANGGNPAPPDAKAHANASALPVSGVTTGPVSQDGRKSVTEAAQSSVPLRQILSHPA
jgi:hypothetical protein